MIVAGGENVAVHPTHFKRQGSGSARRIPCGFGLPMRFHWRISTDSPGVECRIRKCFRAPRVQLPCSGRPHVSNASKWKTTLRFPDETSRLRVSTGLLSGHDITTLQTYPRICGVYSKYCPQPSNRTPGKSSLLQPRALDSDRTPAIYSHISSICECRDTQSRVC